MTNYKAVCVHHIAIQTRDLSRAIEFYVGLLGGTLLERRPFKRRELAWLAFGDLQIELFSVRSGEQLREWDDYFPGPVHLAFLVDDLDRVIAQAKMLGIPLHPSHPEPFVPPVEGATPIAYLLGPDGEEVEIRTR